MKRITTILIYLAALSFTVNAQGQQSPPIWDREGIPPRKAETKTEGTKQGARREAAPRFEDYPTPERYRGRVAPLVLSRDDKRFRTRLRWAAKNERPNFAGHYILTTWGCGAQCLMGALIDARTGKVYSIPFTICCWGHEQDEQFAPIRFRLDSRLIIFEGALNEEGVGLYYYVWEKNRFRLLHSIEKAKE
jgi:hypothetical protein